VRTEFPDVEFSVWPVSGNASGALDGALVLQGMQDGVDPCDVQVKGGREVLGRLWAGFQAFQDGSVVWVGVAGHIRIVVR